MGIRRKMSEVESRGGIDEILSSGRSPSFSVKGQREDVSVPMKYRPTVHPVAYNGRNASQVERDHQKVWHEKREIARQMKRDGASRPGGFLRHKGSVPFEQYAAVSKMVGEGGYEGGELSEELKRRGWIWDKD